MKGEKENLIGSIYSIWTKYCGVVDEYMMLRDRWMYHKSEYYPVLPDLRNSTFKRLEKCIESLDKLFDKKFGLRRWELKKSDEFKGDISDFNTIEDKFFDLSQYVGLLKIAFFQRTVSMEIPHAIAGLPHSPERTIGNELFFVAADRVVKRYLECLNLPDIQWDGFVTFSPPITELYFYGAFCRPNPDFKLFHISMSEEQKYFAGSYLILSHECGHAVLLKSRLKEREDLYPTWFKILWGFTIENLKKRQDKFIEEDCIKMGCEFMAEEMKNSDEMRTCFEDYLADIVAFKIGEVNTCHALLDFSHRPNLLVLLRVNGLLEYEKLSKSNGTLLERLSEELKFYAGPVEKKCFHCISNSGKVWGFTTFDTERTLIPLFPHLINSELRVKKDEEQILKENLRNGVPCFDYDPRLILHAFYEIFREKKDEAGPNYATTIHSIAFNEFREEQV